ncbi:hypothetical protein KPL71_020696 [Citrus sinensis]|uniref:Uncharacterized protein n=1 Tax=Citrus sinensis TaxID=2711 RepID=A0ACB8J9Z6_CITSI|nr:hypothetical protein KPL71_020696 [Citrus sinensis]
MRKNKENRQASSQQAEALSVTRGRLTERGPSGSQNHGRSKSGSKKNVKCYNCGKKGHVKKECWSNQKRREGKESESSNAQGYVANTSDDGEILYSEATTVSEGRKRLYDVWIIDSGTTWHMTSRREWFHTYESISGESVYMGDDHALEITGIGTIKIKIFDGTIRTIGKVRHVNGLKKNLLSLGQMDSHGYKNHVENGIMKIVKGTLVLMKVEKIGVNLFMLKGETLHEADACVALNGEESTMMWHLKLSHMSEQGLKILSERKLLPELKSEEIEALHKNKTWELVPLPRGRKAIGNKLVYKIKRSGNDQVERYRARLVVKGYAQKEGIDFNEIFSPMVRLTTIRVVLAMCATFDLHLEQLDVKTAFLHGQLEEEIYMLQPEGFAEIGKENLVCRLNNSLYGLKQAPSNEAERKEMSRVPYASAMRSLIFAMISTRPDIAQAVGAVSRYMANPGGEHLIAVKRILRYIKGTSDVALCYGGLEFTIRGYVDSDFAGDLDKRKSTTCYVFTLAGAAVSWVSKLQTVVALSTTEAEYMAATQACKEAIWIQRLLEELGHKQKKIYVFCDSQSVLHIARNPSFHSRTKHIGVQYHFVREVVEDGSVDLQKIHTKENLADVLTKPINADKFIWSRSSCGLAETLAT